jgi:uncharacterized protein (TIGR02145 family)
MKIKSSLITIAILTIAMHSVAQVTDIDGNIYKTIPIGLQDWMTENLNVSHFRNGDLILEAKTNEEWKKALADHKPAYCYYNDFSGYARTYGKLYNWYAVIDPRGLAPTGWHVPSDFQWTVLIGKFGGNNVAGGKMKSTWGWSNNDNGTNESGLTCLPGGQRKLDGTFINLGGAGYWWSSSESDTNNAWTLTLDDYYGSIYRNSFLKGLGLSVRCFRD